MLVYRPSRGNDVTTVGISKDAEWFGESLGNYVLPREKLPLAPRNPVESNLSSLSTWFFKDITDYDFINGSTTYRAIYIGANDKVNENEIIGLINASITNDSGDTLLDNSVKIDLWREGNIYDLPSGMAYGSGIVLDNEQDTTNKLVNATWTDSIMSSETLVSGQYIKIWIRIKTSKDISLIDAPSFTYSFTVGNLTIPVNRTKGRLNVSKIYSVSLTDTKSKNDFILKQTLPYDFDTNKIVKIIDHQGIMNVFYFDNGKLKIIAINTDIDINENKYVEIDLSSITGDISSAITSQLYTEVSQCVSVPSSGDPEAEPIINDYINKKFIVDIHSTNKERNIFYVFYNEFVSDDDFVYQENYGHKSYIWKNGVIKVDLNVVEFLDFKNITPGLDNRKYIDVTDENLLYDIGDWHYLTSVVLLDDIFICSGFDVEDCRVTENIAKLKYIWEKDIIKSDIKVQTTFIPKVENNTLKTIKNKSNKQAYLMFDDISKVDRLNLNYEREVIQLDNGKNFVKMGSQTRRKVNHDYSSVLYDVPLKIDDFSATWAFSVNAISLTTQTTGTTSTPTTSAPTTSSPTTSSPTTSSPTTSSPTTSGPSTPGDKLILDNPYVMHLKLQSDFDDALANPYNQFLYTKTIEYENKLCSIFKLHCNGDTSNYALQVLYNFQDKNWKIYTKDKDENLIENTVDGSVTAQDISTDFDNVITINVSRIQVYGCGKKYLVHFDVYSSGRLLYSGETYTTNTTDTYVISHNDRNDFSGGISYFEVREYLDDNSKEYAYSLFQIHSNLSWGELEKESLNKDSPNGFEFYGFRRNILINNFSWGNADNSILFPIVLQGNAYSIDESFNKEVRRSVFDFNKIDVNKPSFSFTFEGISTPLEWYAEHYEFNKDIMVVWVKLQNWKGQRLSMYYGDIRLIQDNLDNFGMFSNFYGLWLMDEFINDKYIRYTTNNIFDVGEGMLVEKNQNGVFMIELDKQYMFGINNLYKSNQFDIKYDDYGVDRGRKDYVKDFIVSQTSNFKPAFMEVRNVDGINNYKLESNNSGQE